MNNNIKIKGIVKEFIDGKKVSEHQNAIHSDLKIAMASIMTEDVPDRSMSKFLTSANILFDGTFIENSDGIAVRDGGDFYSMESSLSSSGNGYIEVTGGMLSDSSRSIDMLNMGVSGGQSGAKPFAFTYATLSKSTNVDLVKDQYYEVIWQISVQ